MHIMLNASELVKLTGCAFISNRQHCTSDLQSHPTMKQPPYDLFGEIPVLLSDLEAWVAAMSPRYLNQRGYASYVRSYNVADKVRAAKAAGLFDEITNRRAVVEHPRLSIFVPNHAFR